MKTTVRIRFYYGNQLADQCWPLARDLLAEFGREDLARRGKSQESSWELCFDQSDPKLESLRRRLSELKEQVGVGWWESAQANYTPTEIDTAPLLRFRCTRSERGYGGAEHGTEFDLSSA